MTNPPNSKSLTQKDIARISAAVLFALAASVWLLNEGDVRISLLRWLTIVIALGLILNTQRGLPIRALAFGAISCAATLVLGAAFLSYMICRQATIVPGSTFTETFVTEAFGISTTGMEARFPEAFVTLTETQQFLLELNGSTMYHQRRSRL